MRRLQAAEACVSLVPLTPPLSRTDLPPADPRWASWNLGVFVCIRCSGVHRGMGTHISRVKSVDLDSWTDEQLQSVLSWGNARANKYWEAKLAPGHKPSDGKVESFIRTKYELKRWVMDGPKPDPASLDDDDNIPLSLVKEKKSIDQKESIRKASIGQASRPSVAPAVPQADLIGGDPVPPRASTTSPPAPKVSSKAAPAPPKTTNTKDSLLGLDFFGDQPAAPPRPASAANTPGAAGPSRPDLKQSILSLYATAPRPQTQPPQQPPAQPFGDAPQAPQQPPSAGLVDAFGGMGLGNAPSPPKPADPFASLTSPTLTSKSTSSNNSFGGLGGGGFFDSKPAQPPAPAAHKQQSSVSSGGLAGLGSLTSPTNNIPPSQPAPSSSAMGDLFDLSAPAPAPAAPAPAPQPASYNPPPQPTDSVFNLTNTSKSPPPAAAAPPLAPTTSPPPSNNWANNDVWGNAWSAPEPAASSPPPHPAPTTTTSDFGWGGPDAGAGSLASQTIVPGGSGFGTIASQPQVSADEEFGGWASSTGAGGAGGGAAKPAAGFGGSDDLFSNVWQ